MLDEVGLCEGWLALFDLNVRAAAFLLANCLVCLLRRVGSFVMLFADESHPLQVRDVRPASKEKIAHCVVSLQQEIALWARRNAQTHAGAQGSLEEGAAGSAQRGKAHLKGKASMLQFEPMQGRKRVAGQEHRCKLLARAKSNFFAWHDRNAREGIIARDKKATDATKARLCLTRAKHARRQECATKAR